MLAAVRSAPPGIEATKIGHDRRLLETAASAFIVAAVARAHGGRGMRFRYVLGKGPFPTSAAGKEDLPFRSLPRGPSSACIRAKTRARRPRHFRLPRRKLLHAPRTRYGLSGRRDRKSTRLNSSH